MMFTQNEVDAALREDFLTFLAKAFKTASGGAEFLENWHHEAISYQLDRIRSGETTRLIVTMPPRYLKSITISVAWVAWMLGRDPSLNFVCVSYSADLALKHAKDCRAILQSDWYRRIFPGTVIGRGGSAEGDFRTTKGGGRLSTSVGGTLTGRGGDIIVIDDPIKPDEAMSETTRRRVIDWYANTLSSRLNDKAKGAVILVMQRLHEEDLVGHLLDAGGWTHLSLPAIAEGHEEIPLAADFVHVRDPGVVLHPERETLAELERQKSVMGSALFAAQYQQTPVPAEGLHVKRDWFGRYTIAPEKQPADMIVQSWDTASRDNAFSDWSVCITAQIRNREVWVLDVARGRLKFPDLLKKASDLAVHWRPDALLIEDAASGHQLIDMLKKNPSPMIPRPIAMRPEGDKVSRFAGQTARIEAGDLILPEEAPWLAGFERELLGFPNLKHDDQVDALTQLLAWRSPPRQQIIVGPELIRLDEPDFW